MFLDGPRSGLIVGTGSFCPMLVQQKLILAKPKFLLGQCKGVIHSESKFQPELATVNAKIKLQLELKLKSHQIYSHVIVT